MLDDLLSIYMEKDIVKAFLDDDAELKISLWRNLRK